MRLPFRTTQSVFVILRLDLPFPDRRQRKYFLSCLHTCPFCVARQLPSGGVVGIAAAAAIAVRARLLIRLARHKTQVVLLRSLAVLRVGVVMCGDKMRLSWRIAQWAPLFLCAKPAFTRKKAVCRPCGRNSDLNRNVCDKQACRPFVAYSDLKQKTLRQ